MGWMAHADFRGTPTKGVDRKISREANGKKTKKYHKRLKIALLSLFQGGANGKKTKNSKKHRKITLLSFYILYLYHV